MVSKSAVEDVAVVMDQHLGHRAMADLRKVLSVEEVAVVRKTRLVVHISKSMTSEKAVNDPHV